MKISIMQPYLLPYIGYWQLIQTSKYFVILDDVNFIKKGYINRNSILLNNRPYRFTLNLVNSSQNKLIKDIKIGNDTKSILKTIEHSYKKSPFFKTTFPIFEDIFTNTEKNLSKFIGYSLIEISKYLGLKTDFIYSSKIIKKVNLKSQDRILEICQKLNADHYINNISGLNLYDYNLFLKKKIKLSFLKTNQTSYKQFKDKFIPNLSIIDIMMFNDKFKIYELLKNYTLIKPT